MLRASVIVPARDAQETLGRTLAALARQQLDGDYEVIVVDDGSRDRTADIARAAPGPVTVLAQPRLGPAAARNRGAEAARAPALAFCDADVYPTPQWLQSGLHALARFGLVQGKLLPDPEAQLGPFDRSIWITSEVGLWETANLLVRRELFDAAGGFEEWLRPRQGKALAEDVWFGYKVKRLGADSSFCSEALAYHEVFPRSWREYVRERRRLQYFPAMARKTPELRRAFLYRQVFLNRRSAKLDLAIAAFALTLASSSPLPLAAGLPYWRSLRSTSYRAQPVGPPVTVVAAADVAADLVGLLSMAYGSLRYRTLVL